MLTGPQIGYLGGIIGSILGLAGGIFGSYCSIKNTKGPLERRFMIKASIVTGIALFIFLGLVFALPSYYRFLVWIPYGIFLPLGIGFINKRQREIQAEEGGILPGDSR
jgi:hypothetical protein